MAAVTHVGGTLRLAGGGQFRGVFDVIGVGRVEGPGVIRVDGESHTLGSAASIAPPAISTNCER